MMMKHATLFGLMLLLASKLSDASCGEKCLFRFCRPGEDHYHHKPLPKALQIIMPARGQADFPHVCRPGRNLLRVRKTGEALISEGSQGLVKISQWRPSGIVLGLARKYFKLFQAENTSPAQGVGRSSNSGYSFLNGRCVILPIRKYEVRNWKGISVIKVRKGERERECISFRTRAPKLVISLQWNNSANLQLRVVDPLGRNGTLVTAQSFTGRAGGQRIVIFDRTVTGAYRASVFYPRGRPISRSIAFLKDESHSTPPSQGIMNQKSIRHPYGDGNPNEGRALFRVSRMGSLIARPKVIRFSTKDSGKSLFTFSFRNKNVAQTA